MEMYLGSTTSSLQDNYLKKNYTRSYSLLPISSILGPTHESFDQFLFTIVIFRVLTPAFFYLMKNQYSNHQKAAIIRQTAAYKGFSRLATGFEKELNRKPM
jgi:hypothetical protein